MKQTILITSLLLPLIHCKTAVWAITYRNISQRGAYNRTTSVDPKTGLCGHERVNYPATGPSTPLFGEVSMHLRGPMNISQLAVYQLPGEMHAMEKRSTVPFYNRRRAAMPQGSIDMEILTEGSSVSDTHDMWFLDKRTDNSTRSCSRSTVTSTVTVTSCPRTRTSMPSQNTTYIGPPLPCLPTPNPQVTDVASPLSNCPCRNAKASQNPSEIIPRLAPASIMNPLAKRQQDNAAGDWNRVAYYTSSAPAQATGLSFLANLGDPRKSGTFDYAFGNSLGYVTPDGRKVASESLPFDGTLDTSEVELAVFSDKQCDQDCPYWRPDATSHYGWAGSSKAFFIEFQMDHHDNRGTDQGLLSDAPAWWFLNAAIPRILQAKSTMHRQGNLEGGDSNYFKRPVGKRLKFAVVWHYPHITAMVLDDGFDFATRLSNEQTQKLVQYDPNSWVHSLFAIGD
ncbi:hypothetical protein IQ07DRAFT_618163 [Pyrenochaeta sp. DS3sAY3a]|nr:hypothetical protein IQ07DRAFT_618163 [Pyrenochaeta sp. DS3sAY3a]